MSADHWTTARLSEIAEIRLGRQRSPKRSTGPNMRPYMRAANVTWNGISLHDVKEMDFTPAEFETYRLRRGDLLLSEASGSASEVGKPAVWEDQVPGCCFQNTLIRVRASEDLVPFLHLHFYKDAVTGAFAEASRGVGIHHLGASALVDWKVHLPPLAEQRRIVAATESYFTRLDDAVATLERVQRNLKRYRASVLKAAVEGRLVPTEAELARTDGRGYEPASVLLVRILAERRRCWEDAELARMKSRGKAPEDETWRDKYEEPTPPDVSRLPSLPDGWSWATTDQLFSFVTSGSRGWARYYSESGAVFIRVGNLNHESINLDLSDVRHVRPPEGSEGMRTTVAPGDILISITADVGMIALVRERLEEAYINQHVSLARPVSSVHLPYLAWFLAAPDGGQTQLLAMRRGATKVGLGLDDIRNVNVPLPPLSEQQRIVDEIDQLLSIASDCDEALSANALRCIRLRQSILTWAFEGRLVDQDPTDEPASVLLERIRFDRERVVSERRKTSPRRRRMESNA